MIRKAAGIEGRYEVDIVDSLEKNNLLLSEVREVRRYKNNRSRPKYRSVVYKKSDRVHPDRAGDTPEIYKCSHQEVCLPDSNLLLLSKDQ